MADHAHDSHAHPQDPNVAPTRSEIVEDFKGIHYFLAALLGGTAIVLGTVFGLLLVND